MTRCTRCNGSGAERIRRPDARTTKPMFYTRVCPACVGTGVATQRLKARAK